MINAKNIYVHQQIRKKQAILLVLNVTMFYHFVGFIILEIPYMKLCNELLQ